MNEGKWNYKPCFQVINHFKGHYDTIPLLFLLHIEGDPNLMIPPLKLFTACVKDINTLTLLHASPLIG